jgi:BTB/POZ domain-containing protein 9
MCDHRQLRSPTPAGIVDHVSSVSDNLGDLVLNAEYSDITLVVEDVSFQSHKVILAARSDYFRYLIVNCNTSDKYPYPYITYKASYFI